MQQRMMWKVIASMTGATLLLYAALFFSAALLFSACTAQAVEAEPSASEPAAIPSSPPAESEELKHSYVQQLADTVVREVIEPDILPEEQIRVLYRYLVERVYFADPVGMNVWRYASQQSEAIPYLENRALSPLLFQIGSCEDFAAAMVMMLRACGFEAEYVAGYTLSVDQVYIDHAWAVVKLEGSWYHLDPQLEQNVTRQNLLTYRYYLKSDDDFLFDHKWGENLIAYYSKITDEEAVNIREHYTPPTCPIPHPVPEPENIPLPVKPNMADIEAEIRRIKAEAATETLPPLRLNVEPPVLIAAMHVTPPLFPQQEEPPAFQYGRSFMDGHREQLYDALAMSMQSPFDGMEIPVPAKVDSEDASYIAGDFLDAHPLYYWANFSVIQTGQGRVLRLSMRLPDSEIARREQLIGERVQEILADVQGGSAFDKALAIHDAVAVTHYDKDKNGMDSANVYGALVDGVATCDGYAQAFQHLAGVAGLESVYIRGRSMTGAPHAWNAVRLDGSWHFVDATWDRPLRAYDDVYHDYFLMDEAETLAERTPEAGQYPELPKVGEGYRSYFERMGYTVSGSVSADSVDVMAGLLYRQLAAKRELPRNARPVYLEFKVLGDKQTYEAWKQIYIKQVFEVLHGLEARAQKENAPFRIMDASSVKCDFNDTTQVLSFYPSVEQNA